MLVALVPILVFGVLLAVVTVPFVSLGAGPTFDTHVAAYLIDRTDRRVRGVADVETLFDLPVLATSVNEAGHLLVQVPAA